MSRAEQLALEFDHRPSLDGEDFMVAPANADAVAWLDRWPDWPGVAVAVHGPPGCGKTHLGRAFLARSNGIEVTLARLAAEAPSDLAQAPALLLDDGDGICGDGVCGGALETALFHLYNAAAERGRCLLLTGRQPPRAWPVKLPDLRSRLNAALAVAIDGPDDALMVAVLAKLFMDRQLKIDSDVPTFMLARMERTFDAACRLVDAIDRAALRDRRNITVPFVRRVMKEIEDEK